MKKYNLRFDSITPKNDSPSYADRPKKRHRNSDFEDQYHDDWQLKDVDATARPKRRQHRKSPLVAETSATAFESKVFRTYSYLGEPLSEEWRNDKGQFHRVDGPAFLYWVKGKIVIERWYQYGKLHRLDGPAEILSNSVKWCIMGECYSTEAEYRKALAKFKARAGFKAVRASNRLMSDIKEISGVPGTMVWANQMGQYHSKHGFGLPKELRNREQCMNATYSAYVDQANANEDPVEMSMKYTKDHLYFIAQGLGLHVTRSMDKATLCELISSVKNELL